jgi:LacI family transcriptional regulator
MVTIKEIARAVGVSPTTVSRVLNYDETLSVSPVKRQAIIETAEALNYATPRKRNRQQVAPAAVREAGRIALIHFLSPEVEFADPYYVGVRFGVEQRCRQNNLEIDRIYPGDAVADEAFLRNVSGIIVVGRHADEEIAYLAQHNRNIVFADFTPALEDFDSVHCDLHIATLRLLEALFAAGYRRFGFVGVEENQCGAKPLPMIDRRHSTYVEWTKARGLYVPELCRLGNLRVESGYELTRDILKAAQPPEILIASNDNQAIGAYRAIAEKGLKIPRDIGVASFNDIPVAQFLAPPLTTTRIHAEHIGEAAVDLLLERIAGREFVKKLFIATEMVWRQSCRSPG